MKLNKSLSFLLAGVMTCLLLASCDGGGTTSTATENNSTTAEAPQTADGNQTNAEDTQTTEITDETQNSTISGDEQQNNSDDQNSTAGNENVQTDSDDTSQTSTDSWQSDDNGFVENSESGNDSGEETSTHENTTFTPYLYSPYKLEIVQPQAGLDTGNRYYKNYPGLEYNVKVAVFGGRFDFLQYTLKQSPVGMTIDKDTGVITWPNPLESVTPYTIKVEVNDGTQTAEVSWTLTVNTENTVFVSSTGSASGDGSINNPIRFIDLYGTDKYDATYQGYQVICRAGTHSIYHDKGVQAGKLSWRPGKPFVFLAYPGEKPVFDFSKACFFFETGGTNFYVDGITHINVGAAITSGEGVWAYRLSGDNIVFRRNRFQDLKHFDGGFNQSYVMISGSGISTRSNLVFSENDCDGNGANGYSLCLLYDCEKTVIESNKIVNCGNIAFGFKDRCHYGAVRGNWAESDGSNYIRLFWFYNELGLVDAPDGGGDFECSWNVGYGAKEVVDINGSFKTPVSRPHHIFRNTFIGSSKYTTINESSEYCYETHNVFVTTIANNYTSNNVSDYSKIVQEDNLVNASTDHFLDKTTGLLIESYFPLNTTRGANGMAGLK